MTATICPGRHLPPDVLLSFAIERGDSFDIPEWKCTAAKMLGLMILF
jgi:hypothetical protein